jgi:hypothetical protein
MPINRISIVNNYELRWQIVGHESYYFTDKKTLVNAKSGREIKRTLIGYTQGYWVDRKFMTLNKLRPLLQRPVNFDVPF